MLKDGNKRKRKNDLCGFKANHANDLELKGVVSHMHMCVLKGLHMYFMRNTTKSICCSPNPLGFHVIFILLQRTVCKSTQKRQKKEKKISAYFENSFE